MRFFLLTWSTYNKEIFENINFRKKEIKFFNFNLKLLSQYLIKII